MLSSAIWEGLTSALVSEFITVGLMGCEGLGVEFLTLLVLVASASLGVTSVSSVNSGTLKAGTSAISLSGKSVWGASENSLILLTNSQSLAIIFKQLRIYW